MSKQILEAAKEALAGEHKEHESKPKKEIKEIRTRKVKKTGGGHSFVHEHVHTEPEHYPNEEHVSPDQDSMVDHLMSHLGEPNPGEAEADAGQSGIPAE